MNRPSGPVLLLACFGVPTEPWVEHLQRSGAALRIRVWPAAGGVSDVDYVLAWNVPRGFWLSFGALKAVFSMGAGVETLLRDRDVPTGAAIVRMEDPALERAMVEYVLLHVLHHHRDMGRYQDDQRRGLWRPANAPQASQRTVGILGLGRLGLACARQLQVLGFVVRGWSRTPKAPPGMDHFAGPGQLGDFLGQSEILVCTLPLTPQTGRILNKALFERLPRGAFLINVGRGGHLDEADLVAALEEGMLSGAVLDVMDSEPPRPDHPFWTDPRILITPHIAGPTFPDTAAQAVVSKIEALERGERVTGVADRSRGY